MKELKIILAILMTFGIAFATSLLFEWHFIAKNWLRYALVVMLILLELVIGFFYVKEESKNLK